MSTKPLVPGKFYYLPLTSVYDLRDGGINPINLAQRGEGGNGQKVFFVGLHFGKWPSATCLLGERVADLVTHAHSGFSQYGEMRHYNYGPPPLIPAEDIDGPQDET
jgi:hypothetical protein